MALFGKKTPEATQEKQSKAASPSPTSIASHAHVLRHARITEKATEKSASGVYIFDVDPSATKRDVAAAVRATYNVVPAKIAVVSVPTKTRRNARTGKRGITGGGKKAYVYLKKGEAITIS